MPNLKSKKYYLHSQIQNMQLFLFTFINLQLHFTICKQHLIHGPPPFSMSQFDQFYNFDILPFRTEFLASTLPFCSISDFPGKLSLRFAYFPYNRRAENRHSILSPLIPYVLYPNMQIYNIKSIISQHRRKIPICETLLLFFDLYDTFLRNSKNIELKLYLRPSGRLK